ncbi:hypothetical protein P22_1361 [Propionispora sp. 2/2-37]|nr:hypothetical protein P22_1361 [Propionispora sp. 2/2-37]
MKYDAILFDLDGTLTDSKPGILRSVQYALEKSGMKEFDLEKLVSFIGPPLTDSFQELYGMNATEAAQAVVYYQEYFSEKGMYENAVYPGIADLLAELSVQGKYLAVATSKPSVFSEKIIEHFSLTPYFNKVVGAKMEGVHSDKEHLIGNILADIPHIPLDKVVMIGDRKFDIQGGQAHGIDVIAAGYGYGRRPELEDAGPTHIAESVADLRSLLLG